MLVVTDYRDGSILDEHILASSDLHLHSDNIDILSLLLYTEESGKAGDFFSGAE